MSLEVAYPPAQACVWMEAGVLRYWLCNHDFDCDNCPLDAALRGVPLASPQRAKEPAAATGDRVRRL
jgi:hypothetical protein